MSLEIGVKQAILDCLETLPAIEKRGPAASIALALAVRLDDPETTAAGAAAASRELTRILAQLGLITMSSMRQVLPNAPGKSDDLGDDLDKLRKRRNEYGAS